MILLDCVSPVRLDVTVASLTSHSALQTEAQYEVGGRGSAGASCKCRHTVNRVSPIRRLARRFAPALPVVGEGEKSRDADIRDKNTMVL
jgi:hypothetical protein